MKKNTHTLRYGARMLLVLTCCLVFGTRAQAQVSTRPGDDEKIERIAERLAAVEAADDPVATLSSLSDVSDDWVEHVDRQFASSLRSPIDAVRERSLQDIIYIASFHGDKVTFKKAISPLLKVYWSDKNEDYRIMALSALSAIGDGHAMERLRTLAPVVRSERLRRFTLLALDQYDRSRQAP